MKRGIWVAKIIGMIGIGVILVFAFTMAVMYLWNWLVPDLFSGPVITFWQALGLLALSKILFSGFGKGGGHSGHWKSHWKSRWSEKWGTMSPEERERFKEKMKDKWCLPRKESSGSDSSGSNG
jgi:hypothetical protein